MLAEMDDILTLPPDFVAQNGGRVTMALPVLLEDDVLGSPEEFTLTLPVVEARRTAYRPAGSAPGVTVSTATLAEPETEEYIGELVEAERLEVRPPAGVTALVPSRYQAVPTPLTALKQAALGEPEKHVVFALAGAKFAVPMEQVVEVRELEHYTPVINVPSWVLGITNLRGDIVSVVDLARLLDSSRSAGGKNTSLPFRNLIVAQTRQGDLTTCLVVDTVHGLAHAQPTEIQKVERLVGDGLTPHTRGILAQGEELLSILDLESLLRSLELTS